MIKHKLQQFPYPLFTRSRGAVVAVRMCSPSGDHKKLVVSAALNWEICLCCLTSQNSTWPARLPNPLRHNSGHAKDFHFAKGTYLVTYRWAVTAYTNTLLPVPLESCNLRIIQNFNFWSTNRWIKKFSPIFKHADTELLLLEMCSSLIFLYYSLYWTIKQILKPIRKDAAMVF